MYLLRAKVVRTPLFLLCGIDFLLLHPFPESVVLSEFLSKVRRSLIGLLTPTHQPLKLCSGASQPFSLHNTPRKYYLSGPLTQTVGAASGQRRRVLAQGVLYSAQGIKEPIPQPLYYHSRHTYSTETLCSGHPDPYGAPKASGFPVCTLPFQTFTFHWSVKLGRNS